MITQTVTFADRKPDTKIVYLGNEDENHAESIKFALPAWLSAARASLFLSLGDYTDIVSLEPTRIYKPTLTHMSRPGVYSAYITAALGDDIVWNSDIFQIFIRDLPEYAEQIEQTYPTAVEQAMKAAAEAMKAASEAAKVTGMTARAVELPAGAEPTAEYADGILTIGIPLGGDVSEEQVTQAVADYLATHPIKESDPTVPDWAKQPDKPSYTADEVGAIAQTENPPTNSPWRAATQALRLSLPRSWRRRSLQTLTP